MRSLYHFLLIFVCTLGFGQTAPEQAQFNKANTFYNDAKYTEAVATYTNLIDNGFQSAELYFNLANAHYKLNNTAQSIYNYEKALLLNPKDENIKQNLAFANNMKIDAIEVLPEIGYSKYFNKFSRLLSTDVWAVLAIAFSIGFTIILIAYFFANQTRYKRLYFILSFVFILLGIFCLSIANYKSNYLDSKTYAIVFAKESKVKSDPSFKSEDTFLLHEGTKILVTTIENDWCNIKLTNGKRGWVLKEDLKLLKEF